jgi:L-fuconolactonase
LVQKFPEQRFVVDHIAKPNIANGVISPWQDDVRALASFDNVYCKLSGMVTEISWGRWNPSDFWPYLDVALDAFGAERLMIGSDWPVCTLSGEYAEVMSIVIDYAAKLSPDERASILGGACAHFYGIVEDVASTHNSSQM